MGFFFYHKDISVSHFTIKSSSRRFPFTQSEKMSSKKRNETNSFISQDFVLFFRPERQLSILGKILHDLQICPPPIRRNSLLY